MLVKGILLDAVDQCIPNGIIQIVATNTSESVLNGSIVWIKADDEGHYSFALLPGSYLIYAQSSRQSDVVFLGETIVTEDTPDGSLNSIVGITTPVLPPQVQQAVNAAHKAAQSAEEASNKYQALLELAKTVGNSLNDLSETVNHVERLSQSVESNALASGNALQGTLQIKTEVQAVNQSVALIKDEILSIQKNIIHLKDDAEQFSSKASSSAQKAQKQANRAVLSANNAAADSQETFRLMQVVEQYRDDVMGALNEAHQSFAWIKFMQAQFDIKLQEMTLIDEHVDNLSREIEQNKQRVDQLQLNAKESADNAATSALRAEQEANRAEAVASIDIVREAEKQATLSKSAADKSLSASLVSVDAKNVAVAKANEAKQSELSAATRAQNAEQNSLIAQEQAKLSTEKASSAVISAKNAKSSEQSALEAANEAASSSTQAKRSANLASSYAVIAGERANTAEQKADDAANQALIATQQAGIAKSNADASLNSQILAANSVELASNQANLASDSANTAVAKATIAINQVPLAQQEADKSRISASEAAQSAQLSEQSSQASISQASVATENAGLAVTKASEVSQSLEQVLSAKEVALGAAKRAETAVASLSGAMIEQGGIDLSRGVAPQPPLDINGAKRACFWKVTVAGTVNNIEYGVDDSIVYSASMDAYYKIDNTENVTSINGQRGVVNLTKEDVGLNLVPNKVHSESVLADSVPLRDHSGDISSRLFRSNYVEQQTISGALAFRIDNVTDNYIRFCSSQEAIRTWLNMYSKNESDSKYLLQSVQDSFAQKINPSFIGRVSISSDESTSDVPCLLSLQTLSTSSHPHPTSIIHDNQGVDPQAEIYKYRSVLAGSISYEYCKSLNINLNGKNGQYVKIASVYIPQNGTTAEIEMTGGGGYNVGHYSQCDHNRIIIRSGNGNPKGINCRVYTHQIHTERFFTKIYTHNVTSDWYDIYLYVTSAYASNLIFKFSSSAECYIKPSLGDPLTLASLPSGSEKGVIYLYSYSQDDIE
ncbi:TPA: hypothetical protein ACX6R5_003264 [Photobacterium damselae]